MKRTPRIALVVLALFFAMGIMPSGAQVSIAKEPLSYDAYNGWRSIQAPQLSRDGLWLAYVLQPQDGDSEIVVRNLKTGAELRSARGKDLWLTVDGKFAVFTIAPPKAETDKAKKEKKKTEDQPKGGLGIMDLATGTVTSIERVKSFKVPEESSAFVAYLLEPAVKKDDEAKEEAKKEVEKKEPEKKEPEKKEPEAKGEVKKPKEKKKEPGTDLVIRELATGKTITVREVVEYAWNKAGTWLGYAVSSKKPEDDGLFAWRTADAKVFPLMKGLGRYKSIVFDDKGGQLAFLADRDDYKAEVSPFRLYHWMAGNPAAVELAPVLKGLPAGMAVSENGAIRFSKDGERLFFGYAPAPQAEPEDGPEPVKVDIWSSRDPDLQTMQKVNAEQEKKRSFTAVVHLKPRRLVSLAGPDLPAVELSEDMKTALGSSGLAYRQLVSWDQSYNDFFLVDLANGSRKKVLEKFPGRVSISPGGRYLLYYREDDKAWYAYDIDGSRSVNLTSKLGVKFFEEDWDTPDDPQAYGFAGWTADDRSVLLYDRFDIWEVKPDGADARCATRGAGRRDQCVFRYRPLDREEKAVPSKTPLLLAATDDRTKASGFSRLTLEGDAEPARAYMADKQVGGLQKAKLADVYVFTQQTFAEFPNLWVSGPGFDDLKKASDANPQQSEYVWGRSELITYANNDGVELPAVLIKPEDFDPSKKYPLMVYIYEKLSDGLHRHYAPAPGTSINFTRYVSNGYIILMPDIVYETGYPGPSAMRCVLPAIQKVVGMGFIDPRRIGIQGHSWGGYQITYMVTQTGLFAAVQAGASVTNMTSAYGGIRWGSGMVREFQYEKSQSRIGAPLFTRVLQYLENSPLFWAERVRTPYLTIHNDEDDAVPWYQGIEFITALRRLGKEGWLFNFNGEKHGLRERENQKYWTVHQDEFFDHYLLGKPRPEWMDKPVPYLERGKRDINALFKKAEEKAEAPAEVKK